MITSRSAERGSVIDATRSDHRTPPGRPDHATQPAIIAVHTLMRVCLTGQ